MITFKQIDKSETEVHIDDEWVGSLLAVKEFGKVNPSGVWEAGPHLMRRFHQLQHEVFETESAGRAAVEVLYEREKQ